MKKFLKNLKKNKFFVIIFFGLLFFLTICIFLLFQSSKQNEKKYIIIENNIKFFETAENQKIIKIKPEKHENQKITEYEIYKLPKYSKDSTKK